MDEKIIVPVEALRVVLEKRKGTYWWVVKIDGTSFVEVPYHGHKTGEIDFDGGEQIEIALRFEEGSKLNLGTLSYPCLKENEEPG